MKNLFIILALFFSVGLFTQNGYMQTQDSELLKSCEIVADRLKQAEIELQSLKIQLALKDEAIANANARAENYKEQAEFWKKANEEGKKIDDNSAVVIQNLRMQVAEYQQENTSLRVENEKLRSSRNFRTLVGFGAGLGLGTIINR